MTWNDLIKIVMVAAASLTVGGCSYDYQIKASAENGRLVLTLGGSALITQRLPHVEALRVERVGFPSKPVWEIQAVGPTGPEQQKITYGQAPKGMEDTIGPAPLEIGQLYQVTLRSTDGGGSGEFAISQDRRVLDSIR